MGVLIGPCKNVSLPGAGNFTWFNISFGDLNCVEGCLFCYPRERERERENFYMHTNNVPLNVCCRHIVSQAF